MKIVDSLVCPACKSDLVRHLDKFGCSSEECIHSKIDHFFVCMDGIPVLISGLARILGSVFVVPLVSGISVGILKFRRVVLMLKAKNTIQTQFYYIFMMVIILSYAVIPVLFQSILFAFIMGVILQPFSVQSAKRRSKV